MSARRDALVQTPEEAAPPVTRVVALPAVRRKASEIRAFTAADAENVARLFQRTFRKGDTRPPAELASYLVELFLDHPARDPEMTSRVCVDADARVRGFIGILPARMRFRERAVPAAIAGSLMVDNPDEDPTTGARLLRAFFHGPQELSFSETSNALSQRMWEKLGGEAVPAFSMEWVRVFRPAGLGVAVAQDPWPAARLLHPVARVADRLIAAACGSALAPGPADPHTRRAAIAAAEFGELAARLSQRVALRPDWSPDLLAWRLRHAANKERFGRLSCAAVLGRKGETLGAYAFYAKPRGLAFVLQVVAQPGGTGTVIDHLLRDAAERGAAGVRGRSTPDLLPALLLRRCLMLHRSSLTLRSRDDALLAAVRSGDAMMTGLAGETWTRLIGDIG